MKLWIKRNLQRLLGFDRYLFLFSIFTICTLRWNRQEKDFLHFMKMIPDGGTVLDIGANIGIMSVWLGRHLKKSTIIAFEPIPQNVLALRKVLKYYKLTNVVVVDKALGNDNGEVQMVMPVLEEVHMQGLSHVLHESIDTFNEGATFTTAIERLDDCGEIAKATLPITAIKLDVENFEYFVLKGGEATLARHQPIVYTELWENENRAQCFRFMTAMGYSIEVLEANTLVKYNMLKHKTQNFFFIPKAI